MIKKEYKTGSWMLSIALGCFGLLLASTVLDVRGGFKALTVLSGSMEPAIKTGGVVFIRQASSYKVGDIVTFGKESASEVPTTHRIIESKEIMKDGKMERFYTTKGDANSSNDGMEVAGREVRGKVYFSIPYLGFAIQMVRQPKWFFVFVILPASTLIYGEILNILGEIGRLRGKKRRHGTIGKEKRETEGLGKFSPYVLDLRYYRAYE